MKHRARIYYSEAQKATMWERWRRGESLHDIAQLFDRISSHSPWSSLRLSPGGDQTAGRGACRRPASIMVWRRVSAG